MAGTPELSIVIPARNATATLPQCLAALLNPALPPAAIRPMGPIRPISYEIIVVDDASTDETAAVAEAGGARVIRLADQSGPAAARNAGVEAARAETVLFLDSDVVAHNDVPVRALATLREHPEIAAVFGSYDDAPPAPNFFSQYKNLLHHYVHQTSSEEAGTFWCGCGAIRRSVFLEVGGLDAARYRRPQIEDVELGARLVRRGVRIRLDKAMQVTHLKRWTLGGLLRSDICDRALPWTELLRRGELRGGDLNLKPAHRLSAGF